MALTFSICVYLCCQFLCQPVSLLCMCRCLPHALTWVKMRHMTISYLPHSHWVTGSELATSAHWLSPSTTQHPSLWRP